MITVFIGQVVKCNTIGDVSSGVIGEFERVCDTPEEIVLGWGADYGVVNGVRCNLHNCVPYIIDPSSREEKASALEQYEELIGNSIVRGNLLSDRNYSPYCGRHDCFKGSPRTFWSGILGQFTCSCGWCSKFPPEFIKAYKTVHNLN